MGFVKSWKTLALCRVLLGVLEAGFFPACVYLISTWYVRHEVQRRLAAFYLTSVLVGGFANVMAYGFTLMEGTAGLHGWQWIFIMCGIITCGLGLLAYPLIVDFPDQNKFLVPAQTAFIQNRIQQDRGDAEADPLTWAKSLTYARDIKIWIFGFLYMFTAMPAYAFGYFLPIILGGMGYNVRDSQLLCAPPYVTAVFSAFCFAFVADKMRTRGIFIIAQSLITILGLSMTAFAHQNSVRYAGVFFGLAGCQGNIPAILAYNANNIVGHSKRSFSSAITVGFGGIGGIIATTVFRQQDSPKYLPGLWTTIGFQIATILVVLGTNARMASENDKKRTWEGEGEFVIEGREGFYYTL
jgi:MFS family permease